MHFQKPEMRLLLAFCFELQRLAGDQPFFLSGRKTGQFLKHPTHSKAAAWLGAFVADDILDEIEKGNVSTGEASRYRWKLLDGVGIVRLEIEERLQLGLCLGESIPTGGRIGPRSYMQPDEELRTSLVL